MQFISTRGEAPALGFSDAVLAGLALRWRPLPSGIVAAFHPC